MGWGRLRDCGELLDSRRFHLKLKGTVYKSYVRPTILHRSEAWCLKKVIWEFYEFRKIHGESNVWSAAQRQKNDPQIYMLGLNETVDQLAMANGVHWYGHVLRREDGHVLRRALDFEVEGQRKKGRPKRTWKKHVEEESVKIGLRRKDALCRSNWSVGVNKITDGLR